jgi:pre-mRNA-splicing factor 18
MDFASLMSAQISKSKSPPSDAQTSSTSSSKYLKRSELEAQRQEAYTAEQARLKAEREERLTKKRKIEEDEAERDRAREEKKRRLAEESKARRQEEEARQERLRRKRLGLPELPPGREGKQGTPLEDGEEDIADEELLTKLRALDEPAVLFGESHAARLRRYKKLTQRALTPKMSDGPIPTTLELVKEAEMKVPDSVPAKGTKERDFLFRQLASYFTMVLREWELALARRDASVKESYQGKAAYNAMVQSRENMRPLFKKFEKGDVEDGVLTPVAEIVRCAQERRYVDANDGYLRLSIGKAQVLSSVSN